jgi:hypothetical protein
MQGRKGEDRYVMECSDGSFVNLQLLESVDENKVEAKFERVF